MKKIEFAKVILDSVYDEPYVSFKIHMDMLINTKQIQSMQARSIIEKWVQKEYVELGEYDVDFWLTPRGVKCLNKEIANYENRQH